MMMFCFCQICASLYSYIIGYNGFSCVIIKEISIFGDDMFLHRKDSV